LRKILNLLYPTIVLLNISCGQKGEDSIYLIPQNFEGNVLIIFNQKDGLNIVYEDHTRVYQIDTSGVLRTKFSGNYGLKRNYYYYVDSLGKRTAVKFALPSQLTGKNEVVVLNPETGNYYDTTKKVERHFEMFTVAKEIRIDSIGNLRSKFMWERLK